MSRFRFRLERVLGVRRLEEELARAGFVEAESGARRAEAVREQARRDVEASLAELARALEARELDADALLVGQGALDRTVKRIPPAARRAKLAREAAERERGAWEARRRALRSLERLRERARRAARAEEERVENLRLDEQALIRAGRARSRQSLSRRTSEEAPGPLTGP